MAHPADIYNKAKSVIFSILNRDGTLAAYKSLDNYRGKIPIPSWFGLKGELDFYSKYKKKFTLDPVWDYGIKCDFTGNFDGVKSSRLTLEGGQDFVCQTNVHLADCFKERQSTLTHPLFIKYFLIFSDAVLPIGNDHISSLWLQLSSF